uniref:Small ribosomal subunit protein uS3m n=1 Tax=Pneumocystis canis TaxID=2698477 RepID=A0A8A6W5G6_9ASCO|nr:hypothetical protein MFR94_mgp04 [Pneumocystis canis]QTK22344.1 hypothetical protein [Pneumocystis canis]QTK22374.1 hypothetical protein [Pneumocystis canis]
MILSSTLNLKESQNIYRILNLYFGKLGLISNPRIKITSKNLYITFYYYSQIHSYTLKDLHQLEKLLSLILKKTTVLKAIPLKYPFLDSLIFAKYLANKKDPLRINLKTICKSAVTSHEIPKYISGIEIKIQGWYLKSSTRTLSQILTIGTKTKNKDQSTYEFYNSNGSNTLAITLYSTPLFILLFLVLNWWVVD